MLAALLARTPSLRALRHRHFRAWMLAGLVSVSGTWMQQVAQAWLVLQRTHSGSAVGVLVAMQAAPSLLLGMWGGTLADRHDRRRLLLATQSCSALLALGLAVTVATSGAHVLVIQLFGLASGLVAAVDGPASGTYGSSLLPPDDLANGLALGSVVASTGRVVGLALAGIVVALTGPVVAFALNGLSFAAPIVVLALAPASRPVAGSAQSTRRQVGDGVRHVWDSTEARTTVLTSWFLSCFGRNFQVTMAVMAAEAFHGGAGLYGRFSSLFAIGALGGSVVATRLGRMSRRVLAGAALVAGAMQIASGLAGGPHVFGLLLVPIAGAAVVIDTATSARVQLSTDAAMRGRVLAIVGIAGTTAAMVGGPLLGWLSRFGPRVPLLLGGLVVLAATTAYGSARHGRPDPTRHQLAPYPRPA